MGAEFWVAVSFLCFVGLLVYMKVPAMIATALDDRSDAIRKELDEARRLREEAQDLLADYKQRQRRADDEAKAIIEEAEKEAQALKVQSEKALKELTKLFNKVEETYMAAISAMKQRSEVLARQAVELEDEVDVLERKSKRAHIKRTTEGVCVPEADVMFTEILRNLERIGDHADNIAYDILDTFYNHYQIGTRKRTPKF